MGVGMNLYRDKIYINGVEIPAKVYVHSMETKAGQGGGISEVSLTITIAPSQYRRLPQPFNELLWRDARFDRRGIVIPIIALGRVDHYEITAVSPMTPG